MIDLQGTSVVERNTWMKQLLSQGVYEVTFTKVDGETRVMPCTLASSHLPPAPMKEKKVIKEEKLDTISVWCTDKKEWRSFRVMNVTAIKEL
jgi:hypothetical protein